MTRKIELGIIPNELQAQAQQLRDGYRPLTKKVFYRFTKAARLERKAKRIESDQVKIRKGFDTISASIELLKFFREIGTKMEKSGDLSTAVAIAVLLRKPGQKRYADYRRRQQVTSSRPLESFTLQLLETLALAYVGEKTPTIALSDTMHRKGKQHTDSRDANINAILSTIFPDQQKHRSYSRGNRGTIRIKIKDTTLSVKLREQKPKQKHVPADFIGIPYIAADVAIQNVPDLTSWGFLSGIDATTNLSKTFRGYSGH